MNRTPDPVRSYLVWQAVRVLLLMGALVAIDHVIKLLGGR